MVRSTIEKRNRDVADYLAQTDISDQDTSVSSSSKSTQQSAVLAQQLASESSWADRYVPSTSDETNMGRDIVSVVSNGLPSASTYATPEDAPPTYELATSDRNTIYTPPASEASHSTRAPMPSNSESQSLINVQHVSLSGPQGLMPAGSSQTRAQGEPQIPIRPPFAPGKHYERHETSQPIHGTFTLHDSLDLSTTSGSIGISIDVMPGPHPATLRLKSTSGSINVTDKQYDVAQSRWGSRQNPSCGPRGPGPLSFLFGWARQRQEEGRTIEQPPMPSSDDPRKQAGQDGFPLPQQQGPEVEQVSRGARVIHTTIETSSGSVNAQLVLTPGSETRISTSSGSIGLRLATTDSRSRTLTSAATDLRSFLSTRSSSGSQNIHITTGYTDPSSGAIISACQARHHCTGSSSVFAYYPREWIGLVHASVGGSGSIGVRGNGLEHDRRGNKEEYAWRGVEFPDIDKAIELRCDGSGSIGFHC